MESNDQVLSDHRFMPTSTRPVQCGLNEAQLALDAHWPERTSKSTGTGIGNPRRYGTSVE